jgi:hypothetical protein
MCESFGPDPITVSNCEKHRIMFDMDIYQGCPLCQGLKNPKYIKHY